MLLQGPVHPAEDAVKIVPVAPDVALGQLGQQPLLDLVFQLLQRLIHTGIVQIKGFAADGGLFGQLRDPDLRNILLVQQREQRAADRFAGAQHPFIHGLACGRHSSRSFRENRRFLPRQFGL